MASTLKETVAFEAPRRSAPAPAAPEYPTVPLPVMALFLGYVAFWYLQGGIRFEALGRIRFEFIVGAALGALAILTLIQRKQVAGKRRSSGIVGWIAALFALATIMTALSHTPAASWSLLIDRVLKFAMMALFIVAFVPSPRALRWFLGIYLLAFAKMAQEGMTGLITGSMVWENQGTPRLHGATPMYAHPNSFSGTQLGTVPFLASLIPLVPRWLKPALLAQAAAAVTVVVTTGSRTGYVALMLWLAWTFWQSKSKFRSLVVAGFAAALLLPYIPGDYYERFETIFTQEDKEGASIEARREILSDTLTIIAENPFGVGVGAFSSVRQERFGRHQETHNLYLEVAADLGLQGLIVFCGMLIAMLRSANRIVIASDRQLRELDKVLAYQEAIPEQRIQSHRRDIELIRAAGRALMAFLMIRIGLGLFGHDFYEIYWWFAAGLLIALSAILSTAEERTKSLISADSSDADGASRSFE